MRMLFRCFPSLSSAMLALFVMSGCESPYSIVKHPAINLPSSPDTNPTPVSTPDPNCTAATTTQNLRIMFMIDNSGSTTTTDPNLYYRVQTLQRFVQDYGSHTNLSYSFGYFNGTTARQYDGAVNKFVANPVMPFGTSSFLSSAVSAYENVQPNDTTPYSAAFNSLQSVVVADQATGVKENYVVVFMSDGQPTDISGNQINGITQMVQQLRTTVESNHTSLLTVSAVYFGSANDTTSINNLTAMAKEGQGQFIDTNKTLGLEINDVITVPGSCSQ